MKRSRVEVLRIHLSSVESYRGILATHPYDLLITHFLSGNIEAVLQRLDELGHLYELEGFTGGPGVELSLSLLEHANEGIRLHNQLASHLRALISWYREAVVPPRW